MALESYRVVGNEFKVGFRPQVAWGWSMATSFFFGEIGAGLFFVSALLGHLPGLILGLLMAAIGKPLGHFLHLGQPSRAWRAMARVRGSWVSRGLLAIVVFTVAGALHVADVAWRILPMPLSLLVLGAALLAALVIMVYQGLAMSHSSSITLWSTGLMPVASFTYALLGGVSLMLVLASGSLPVARPQTLELLRTLELGLLLYGLVVVLSLLHAARYGSSGGKASVELLLKKDYAKWFVALVIVTGFVVSGLLVAFGASASAGMLVAAVAELSGYYAFRILMFKAGTYDPLMSFTTSLRRY